MSNEPVSVVVERRVLPGKQHDFEELLQGIIEVSKEQKGYLGTNVIKPDADNSNYYQVIFRFDSQANLNRWIESDLRRSWVEKIDTVIEEPTKLQYITGLETWFALPGQKTITPPPKYKMAIVTWIAITPLLIVFNLIFGPLLGQLPLIPRFLATTPWIVLIMTYLWMPFITKAFKKWLYPKD